METTVHSCEHTVWKGLYTTRFNYPARICFFFSIFSWLFCSSQQTLFVIDPDVYASAKQWRKVTKPIGLRASAVAREKCRNTSRCAPLSGMHWEHFGGRKTHFSRLISILPGLLKRSNIFLPSPCNLMGFTKTVASCCSCWAVSPALRSWWRSHGILS